jgi:hypothetical protein
LTELPVAPVVEVAGLAESQAGSSPPPLLVEIVKGIGCVESLVLTVTDPAAAVCPMPADAGEQLADSVGGDGTVKAMVVG